MEPRDFRHTSLCRPLAVLAGKGRALSAVGHLAQLLRFVAAGAVGFVVGLVVLTGLHGLAGINYLVAYVASFFAANGAGYLLNAYFTFSARSVNRAAAIRYMAINAAMLCVNTVALKLLVERAHIWYVTAAIVLAVAATPVTFVAHRLVTYRLGARTHAGT
jgi:putative flippase GtrA